MNWEGRARARHPSRRADRFLSLFSPFSVEQMHAGGPEGYELGNSYRSTQAWRLSNEIRRASSQGRYVIVVSFFSWLFNLFASSPRQTKLTEYDHGISFISCREATSMSNLTSFRTISFETTEPSLIPGRSLILADRDEKELVQVERKLWRLTG